MANTKKSNSKKSGSKLPKKAGITIIVIIVAIAAALFVVRKVNPELGAKIDQTISKITGKTSDAGTSKETAKTETEETTSGNKSSRGSKDTGTKSASGATKPVTAENDPLYFGNPSGATADEANCNNYLMVKPQYTLSYNKENLGPNWVMWHLCASDTGDVDRGDNFEPDTTLPKGWYQVVKSDYQYTKYNFDRGHVCPSADRTDNVTNNDQTFLMTNMLPQSPDLNRQIWKEFEIYERGLAVNGKEVYICAGPYGKGGTTDTGTWDYIDIPAKKNPDGKLKILVPAYCWKVVLVLDEGKNDYNRVTKDSTVIAVMMPNKMGMQKTGSWEQYLCSIDDVEAKTGYDFFSYLPDDVEDTLEAKVYSK